MPIKLTDELAKSEPRPPKGNRIVYDTEVKGLGLRITAADARVFTLDYEIAGKSRRYSIGRLDDPFTVGKARKRAKELKHRIALGDDPQVQKEQERAQAAAPRPDTFADIVRAFLTMLAKKDRADRYVVETGRNLANHVVPRWGGLALSEISRKDVIAMLDDIAENGTLRLVDGKKVRASGGGIAANRVLAGVRAMFNFAIRRGLVDVNPCTLVERPGHEAARDRTLSKDEIRELWPAFAALAYPFGVFFQICLLTGQRRGEVAGMRWADIDFDARTWTLSSDQTKAGRVHVVPLSAAAMALIESAPRKPYRDGKVEIPSSYVFTSDGDVPTSGFSRAKAQVEAKVLAARRELDPEAVPMEAWGIHDLRRTAATMMGGLGIGEIVISRILNHAAAGVTARHYNHYEYVTEKRHALDVWASHLGRLIAPADDNVIELAAAKRA
jgi:integrase